MTGLRDDLRKMLDRNSTGVIASKDGEVKKEVDHDKVAFSDSLQHSLNFVYKVVIFTYKIGKKN